MKTKTVIIICIICFIVAAAIAPWKVIANSVADSMGYEIDWYRVEAFFQRDSDMIENQIGTEKRQPEPQAVAVEQPEPQYDPDALPLEFRFRHPDGCVTCVVVDNQLLQYADALIPTMGFRPPKADDSRVLIIEIDHLPQDYVYCGDSPISRTKPYHCTGVGVSFWVQLKGGEPKLVTYKLGGQIITDAPPSVWGDYSNPNPSLMGPGLYKPYSVAVSSWLTDYYSYIQRLQY